MVDPGKKPEEGGSGSQVFSSNAKLMWDELAETYDKIDGSVIFNMHYKINTDHCQLLKLMQFVMGLDYIYAPIRSTLLTTDPLPKAFSLLSRDESYRNIHSGGSGVKYGSSAFVFKFDNKESVFFAAKSTDNRKRFNNNNNNTVRNPSLFCKHCNMNGHTIKRCFEIIGYPPNFKRKNNTGQNSNNVSVTGKETDPSGGAYHTLTNDQYKRLMSLLSDSGPFSSASQSNMAVAHHNGTKSKVNQIGSCKLNEKLIIHDDSVLKTQVETGSEKAGLYFLNLADHVLFVLKDDIDLKGYFSSEPCDICHRAEQTRKPFPLSDHK
nr:hypothetical protein [Tanacetum cinerariifolium]